MQGLLHTARGSDLDLRASLCALLPAVVSAQEAPDTPLKERLASQECADAVFTLAAALTDVMRASQLVDDKAMALPLRVGRGGVAANVLQYCLAHSKAREAATKGGW